MITHKAVVANLFQAVTVDIYCLIYLCVLYLWPKIHALIIADCVYGGILPLFRIWFKYLNVVIIENKRYIRNYEICNVYYVSQTHFTKAFPFLHLSLIAKLLALKSHFIFKIRFHKYVLMFFNFNILILMWWCIATGLLQCIQQYRIAFLNIVPPIAVLFAKHPEVDKYQYHKRNIISMTQ